VPSPENRTSARVQAALRSLWLSVIPALLAGLAVKYLNPGWTPAAEGVTGWIGRAMATQPVIVAVALFLLFAAIARYWRDRLPGGPFLSTRAAPLPKSKRKREAIGLAVAIALAAGAALALRARVAESYVVQSASMVPSLEPGDRIAGTKVAPSAARRGDMIVFRTRAIDNGAQGGPPFLVKRVIGLPDDRITMQAGRAVINGWLVPACDAGQYLYVLPGGEGGGILGRLLVEFLEDRTYLTVHAARMTAFNGAYDVRPGEVFVLGDNRNNSSDSRAWNRGRGGGVPLGAIEARAQWFLAGTHRDGAPDLDRAFRPLGSLGTKLHLEGVDRRPLEEGIAKCLKERPSQTYPPPPGAAGPTAGNGP
jgi:signal peptidase I